MPPKPQAIKAKINKWDDVKLQSFCTAKEAVSKMNKKPMEYEKIFANHLSDEKLILKYIRNSYKSIAKKQKIL